jgi:hypothetical protein
MRKACRFRLSGSRPDVSGLTRRSASPHFLATSSGNSASSLATFGLSQKTM